MSYREKLLAKGLYEVPRDAHANILLLFLKLDGLNDRREAHLVKLIKSRYGYCPSDLPDFEELLDESDDRLFSKTLNNSTHTLHTLLPPQTTASQHYHLRPRTHDRQLPTQISHLCTKNFVTRALYKDCY